MSDNNNNKAQLPEKEVEQGVRRICGESLIVFTVVVDCFHTVNSCSFFSPSGKQCTLPRFPSLAVHLRALPFFPYTARTAHQLRHMSALLMTRAPSCRPHAFPS